MKKIYYFIWFIFRYFDSIELSIVSHSDEINTLKNEIEFLKKSTSKPKEEAVPKPEVVKKVEQQPTAPVEPIEHIISTFDKPFW